MCISMGGPRQRQDLSKKMEKFLTIVFLRGEIASIGDEKRAMIGTSQRNFKILYHALCKRSYVCVGGLSRAMNMQHVRHLVDQLLSNASPASSADDSALLRRFIGQGDQEAYSEIVRRN